MPLVFPAQRPPGSLSPSYSGGRYSPVIDLGSVPVGSSGITGRSAPASAGLAGAAGGSSAATLAAVMMVARRFRRASQNASTSRTRPASTMPPNPPSLTAEWWTAAIAPGGGPAPAREAGLATPGPDVATTRSLTNRPASLRAPIGLMRPKPILVL